VRTDIQTPPKTIPTRSMRAGNYCAVVCSTIIILYSKLQCIPPIRVNIWLLHAFTRQSFVVIYRWSCWRRMFYRILYNMFHVLNSLLPPNTDILLWPEEATTWQIFASHVLEAISSKCCTCIKTFTDCYFVLCVYVFLWWLRSVSRINKDLDDDVVVFIPKP